jgi:hypothetical protein
MQVSNIFLAHLLKNIIGPVRTKATPLKNSPQSSTLLAKSLKIDKSLMLWAIAPNKRKLIGLHSGMKRDRTFPHKMSYSKIYNSDAEGELRQFLMFSIWNTFQTAGSEKQLKEGWILFSRLLDTINKVYKNNNQLIPQ